MKRLFSTQGSARIGSTRITEERRPLLKLSRLFQLQIMSWIALCGSLVGLTSAAALIWVTPAVRAYTAEDVLTVSRVTGENYTALARRAEYAARSLAQQRFDRDILLTRVVITVLGQNGGQTAPVLTLDVNRNDWQRRPDPQYWARYYRSTPLLLGINGTAPVAQPPASLPPSPTPASPTASPAAPAAPANAPTPSPTPNNSNNPGSTPNSGSTPPIQVESTSPAQSSPQPVPPSTIPFGIPPERVNSRPVPTYPAPPIVPQTRVNSQPVAPQ
jgi:hypothetical protein